MEPSAGSRANHNPAFEAAAGKQEQVGNANAREEERREAKVVALAEWCSHREVRLGQKRKGKREKTGQEENAEVKEWRVMAEEMAKKYPVDGEPTSLADLGYLYVGLDDHVRCNLLCSKVSPA